ncbi:TM2 domain-containing protein [Campylobacter lari]|uniref:TM2 domain-containing protein n=1 Tax=Campylobacter lari TaxID=201 RepID=UPI00064014EC|nr:TM2 domain-containing protein [Campylobacter lari]AKJ52869.1 hypothetical protein CD56_00210 [Campylobacter lari]EAK0445670.1 TM2 domain-containing protein [Campylobacter lari]MBT0759539.1 TM2 domain-containing protein [Campylobacter lari]MBT0819757.1 TM2 domain-containing protein [Campylobacter lari]MCR6516556.1 TM2 domain-containing protein [Campylobacter lari]
MDANSVFLSLKDKTPSNKWSELQQKLSNASEEALSQIALTPLKSNIVALVIGIFFGWCGADRFYIGDKKIAFAKIALFVFIVVVVTVTQIDTLRLIITLYVLVDLYFVWKETKKRNLSKIYSILD